MHVAFTDACRRNPNQLRLTLQGWNVLRAAVAHSCAQTADELIDQACDAAFVRDAAFDGLRPGVVGAARRVELELVLEVAVAAAAAHGADRPHAAVLLEAAALIEDQLARALVGAGEEVANHHGAGADGDGL